MAFRMNDSQQLSLSDTLYGLTAREQKALERSWAKVFAEDIFPAIDEARFAVLYSEKASRPNTPVNVIIGALILKELFDLSDDEVVEDLLLDPRFQYALHTTSFEEQPISDKTLTRFRQRCYDYERLESVDLFHDCVTDLSARTARLMKVDGRIRRMDSLMVAANIRILSRMELIYRCIAKMTGWMVKNGEELPDTLQHYNDPNDYNQVIYHSRSTDAGERMAKLLADAGELLLVCGSRFEDVTEYQLLVRCLSEQTMVRDGRRKLRTKEDDGMGSTMLQNPSDPDATYREKAGKKHRGYTANVEESVGEAGSLVTDY
ncbi:MAG: transposase, partial [Lachnospiraceae bacterium]|nr:transposase [Lachnospiraceae bacterium]